VQQLSSRGAVANIIRHAGFLRNASLDHEQQAHEDLLGLQGLKGTLNGI